MGGRRGRVQISGRVVEGKGAVQRRIIEHDVVLHFLRHTFFPFFYGKVDASLIQIRT